MFICVFEALSVGGDVWWHGQRSDSQLCYALRSAGYHHSL